MDGCRSKKLWAKSASRGSGSRSTLAQAEIWAESPWTLPGPPTVPHTGPASGLAAGRRLGSLIWAPHGTGLREALHTHSVQAASLGQGQRKADWSQWALDLAKLSRWAQPDSPTGGSQP